MDNHFALEREKRRATELAELEKLLRFPFNCGPLVHAHRDCVAKHGDWRPCDALRGSVDACVEAGERRRFQIARGCKRWKRLYASCLLHQGEVDCDEHLLKFHRCVTDVGANGLRPEADTPPSRSEPFAPFPLR